MSRRHVLTYDMFSKSETVGSQITSDITNLEQHDKATVHVTFDAGIEASLSVQCRNVKKNSQIEESPWFELDFGSAIVITSTDTDLQLVLNERPAAEMRLVLTINSGTPSNLRALLNAYCVGA